MKKYLIILLPLMCWDLNLNWVQAADSPSVRFGTEITPKKIYLGDLISCHFTVTYSSSVAVVPSTTPLVLGEFELRHNRFSDPRKVGADKLSVEQYLTIVCFSTGPQILPAIPFKFSNSKGSILEAATEPVTIEISSLMDEKGDEGGLRPLKGFFTVPTYLWLWIVLGGLSLIGLVFVILMWKRKSTLHQTPTGPPRPPEEIAWEALERLEDSDLIENGFIKEFYSQLSFILRLYLEQRYKISALERTTNELMLEFRLLNLPARVVSILKEFLETGDLVKFAKFLPYPEDIINDLNRVKEIIGLTTPQIQRTEEQIPV